MLNLEYDCTPVTSDFYTNKALTEPVNLMGFFSATPFQILYVYSPCWNIRIWLGKVPGRDFFNLCLLNLFQSLLVKKTSFLY